MNSTLPSPVQVALKSNRSLGRGPADAAGWIGAPLLLVLLLAAAPASQAQESVFQPGALLADAGIKTDPPSAAEPKPYRERVLEVVSTTEGSSGLWSFEFGVGVISDNTPNDYYKFSFDPLEGPGSGYTYNMTVARQVAEFDWKVFGVHLRPTIEIPFRLTLVDQQEGGLLPDVNLGAAFRWRNFPWNRWIAMTFSVGCGISYSSPVWTADIQRHPTQLPRSEWKFWMPMEFTLAHPKYPNYQLTAFADHQSGGTIFDTGGVDAWGFGIRIVF